MAIKKNLVIFYHNLEKERKKIQIQTKNDCHTGPGAEQQTRQTLYTLKIPKDSKCIHW